VTDYCKCYAKFRRLVDEIVKKIVKKTSRLWQPYWKRTHSAADWSYFKSLRNQYRKLILSSEKQYYSSLVSSASDNPKRLWQTVNKLLHRKSSSPLYPPLLLVLHLQTALLFFKGKISKLRLSLTSNLATSSPH